jgi:hypothetical protein
MADQPTFNLKEVQALLGKLFKTDAPRSTNYPVPDYTQQPPQHPNVGYSQDAPWEAPQAMLAPNATSHSPLQQIAALRALQAQQAQRLMAQRRMAAPQSLYQAAQTGVGYADRLSDLNFWEDPRKNFS